LDKKNTYVRMLFIDYRSLSFILTVWRAVCSKQLLASSPVCKETGDVIGWVCCNDWIRTSRSPSALNSPFPISLTQSHSSQR
jgi:hypothetical protein